MTFAAHVLAQGRRGASAYVGAMTDLDPELTAFGKRCASENNRKAEPFPMHKHLRAWRHLAGLTQAEVASSVATTHATVSRWEAGVLSIPAEKLNDLALLYGATPAELLFSPTDRGMARRLHRAAKLIEALPPDEAEQWLALGTTLAGRKSDLR